MRRINGDVCISRLEASLHEGASSHLELIHPASRPLHLLRAGREIYLWVGGAGCVMRCVGGRGGLGASCVASVGGGGVGCVGGRAWGGTRCVTRIASTSTRCDASDDATSGWGEAGLTLKELPFQCSQTLWCSKTLPGPHTLQCSWTPHALRHRVPRLCSVRRPCRSCRVSGP